MNRFPEKDSHGNPRTPYAINCADCALVYLSKEEYSKQMSNPDALWRCPNCRQSANWNDDNYEEFLDSEPTGS